MSNLSNIGAGVSAAGSVAGMIPGPWGAAISMGAGLLGKGLSLAGAKQDQNQAEKDAENLRIEQENAAAATQGFIDMTNANAVNASVPNTALFAYGGQAMHPNEVVALGKFLGQKHEQGGTPFGDNKEAEKDETITSEGYVFSDKLRPAKSKYTYANRSEKIRNKFKGTKNDPIEQEELKRQLDELAVQQEGTKTRLGLNTPPQQQQSQQMQPMQQIPAGMQQGQGQGQGMPQKFWAGGDINDLWNPNKSLMSEQYMTMNPALKETPTDLSYKPTSPLGSTLNHFTQRGDYSEVVNKPKLGMFEQAKSNLQTSSQASQQGNANSSWDFDSPDLFEDFTKGSEGEAFAGVKSSATIFDEISGEERLMESSWADRQEKKFERANSDMGSGYSAKNVAGTGMSKRDIKKSEGTGTWDKLSNKYGKKNLQQGIATNIGNFANITRGVMGLGDNVKLDRLDFEEFQQKQQRVDLDLVDDTRAISEAQKVYRQNQSNIARQALGSGNYLANAAANSAQSAETTSNIVTDINARNVGIRNQESMFNAQAAITDSSNTLAAKIKNLDQSNMEKQLTAQSKGVASNMIFEGISGIGQQFSSMFADRAKGESDAFMIEQLDFSAMTDEQVQEMKNDLIKAGNNELLDKLVTKHNLFKSKK